MINKDKKTANYKVIQTPPGNRYQFFCDLSNALICTTPPMNENNPDDELTKAWLNYGKNNFNVCHKCGKWIIDALYNPDTFNCVKCTPLEDYPEFCPQCGAETSDPSYFCHMCGYRLLYGGEENEIAK